jgi:hypothetical protein
MQNKHKHFKICSLLQNLSNMQKYAHSNFRSDIHRETNLFRTVLYLTKIKKSMQMLEAYSLYIYIYIHI